MSSSADSATTTMELPPAAPVAEPVVENKEEQKTKASTAVDRAFQNMFSIADEIIVTSRQKEVIDGRESHPRLSEVPPTLMQERLKTFKKGFDSASSPEVHVDVVMELYGRVRSALLRGYQCNSWLDDQSSVLYHGVSAETSGDNVLNLDVLHIMLESLKRADTKFREHSNILRIRFACNLYALFASALRYTQVYFGPSQVADGKTEEALKDDIAKLVKIQGEIVAELPAPASHTRTPAASGPGSNPFSMLASSFPGGLSDVMGSMLKTLPDIMQTVARTTGTEITQQDRAMIDQTMGNLTSLLGNPDGIRSMMEDIGSGGEGMSRLVQRVMGPPSGAAGPTAHPPSGGPPLS